MKKFYAFLLFCVLPVLTYGYDWSIEARGGYFRFNNDVAREIYKSGGADYEVEVAAWLCPCLTTWGNVNYFERKHGRSLNLEEPTSIRLTTLSAGLKYYHAFFCDSCIYLGAGGTYAFLRGHDGLDPAFPGDEAAIIIGNTNKNGLGFVMKSGITYPITSCFFVDLFADWYYQRMRFHLPPVVISEKADVGGWRFGGGIGYNF